MALVDDLVQFVSDNTLDGSWYKPQLKQRCEEFLEDGGIVAPTGTISITENGTVDVTQYASAEVEVSEMPDKVTVAMMESVEWPTIVDVATEDVDYYKGDNIDEVLGINETSEGNNCSYMVLWDTGNPQPSRLVYMPFSEGEAVCYSAVANGIVAYTMRILRHSVIEMVFSDSTDRYTYDAESDTYIYDSETEPSQDKDSGK